MKMKRIGAVVILMLLFVAACGKENETKGLEESAEEVVGKETGGVSETVSEETHIKRTLEDGIEIDAEVINPLGRKAVPVYDINLKEFSADTARELLLPDEEAVVREEEGGTYVSTEEETLQVGTGLSYSVVRESVLYGQFTTLEKPGEQEDLPFCTLEEACRKVEETVKALGVEQFRLEKACTIDYKAMQEKEDTWKDDPDFVERVREKNYPYKGTWEPEDGMYTISLEILQDQAPVYDKFYTDTNGNEIGGYGTEARYTKDGIIALHVDGCPEIQKESDRWDILGAEEIADRLEDKFDLLIMTGDLKISEFQLMYLTALDEEGGLQLIPIWRVKTEQERTVDGIMELYGYNELPEAEREEVRKSFEEDVKDRPVEVSYTYYHAKSGEELLLS